MHTWVGLPGVTIAVLAGTYFLGLRRSEDGTLVMIQSTTACPLLTLEQCLVSAPDFDSILQEHWLQETIEFRQLLYQQSF